MFTFLNPHTIPVMYRYKKDTVGTHMQEFCVGLSDGITPFPFCFFQCLTQPGAR